MHPPHPPTPPHYPHDPHAEGDHEHHESGHSEGVAHLGGAVEQVESVLEDVERQLARIRRLKDDQHREIELFTEKAKQVAEQELELTRQRVEIERERVELEGSRGDVEHERGEVERLRDELESQKGSVRHECETLAAQRTELDERMATLDTRLEAISAREDAIEQRLKTAQDAEQQASSHWQQIDTVARELGERERGANEGVAALRENVHELERELDQVRAANRSSTTDHDETAQELSRAVSAMDNLRDQLNDANATNERLEQESSEHCGVDPEEIAKRDKAIEMLQDRLKQSEERASDLEQQVQRLSKSAQHGSHMERVEKRLRMRRERLRKQKTLLTEQAHKISSVKQSLAKKQKNAEEAAKMREVLAVDQKKLDKALGKAQRNAARGKVGVFFLCVVLGMTLIAGASWEIAGRIKPATYIASATLAADTASGVMSAERTVSWGAYHQELSMDPQLMERAADRLKRRGILELGSAPALRTRLRKDLTVTVDEPGKVSLTFVGEGEARTARILDTYTTAFVSAANGTRNHRMDRTGTKVIAVAATDEQPIEDPRVALFGLIAGSGTALALLVTSLAWRSLVTRKCKIEAELSPENDPDPTVDFHQRAI